VVSFMLLNHKFDWSGALQPGIASNIGRLYSSQPWRPFLAVYWSTSLQAASAAYLIAQIAAGVLLTVNVRWFHILALQLVPPCASNVLAAAVMPDRPLCGGSVAHFALLIRTLFEWKNMPTPRWKFVVPAVFASVATLTFGLTRDVTNVGHLHAAAWAACHKLAVDGPYRSVSGALLLVLTILPVAVWGMDPDPATAELASAGFVRGGVPAARVRRFQAVVVI